MSRGRESEQLEKQPFGARPAAATDHRRCPPLSTRLLPLWLDSRLCPPLPGVLGGERAAGVAVLQQLIDGVCSADFNNLRKRVERGEDAGQR